jgi:hypothetical protein
MLLSEMVIAIGIAVVLIVAAVGGLAARVMGPEETALLRAARASAAQRGLMASAVQQEREARAAKAQRRLVALAAKQEREARAAAAQRRRLVAAAAQQEIRRCLELLYEDALSAPLSPRLTTLITQLETQGA